MGNYLKNLLSKNFTLLVVVVARPTLSLLFTSNALLCTQLQTINPRQYLFSHPLKNRKFSLNFVAELVAFSSFSGI